MNAFQAARGSLGKMLKPEPKAEPRRETLQRAGQETATEEGRKAALLELVKARYNYARDSKFDMLRVWATSLAFYTGEQWRTWDDKQRRLVRNDKIPSWRVLPVYNQLPGIIDLAASKLSRARDLPRARPDDADDPDDRARAEKATQAMRGWWHREEMPQGEHEANVNRILFGAGFMHLYWDPNREAKIPQYENPAPAPPPVGPLPSALPQLPPGASPFDGQSGGQPPAPPGAPDPLAALGYQGPPEPAPQQAPPPGLLEQGGPAAKVRAAYATVGELCYEVLTPFDVFPEPVERFREASWVIIAKRKPLHWFRQTFPGVGDLVTADEGEVESAFSSLVPGMEGGMGGTRQPAPDGDGQATLWIYYQKPDKEHKQGLTVYAAGTVLLLEVERLPLPFKGLKNPLPVKMLAYRYVPKRLWPKGLIEECLSPQREMNRGLGNLAEILRLFRGPKRFMDRSWKVDRNAITSSPDEVVEGDFKGANPTQWVESPPQLPAWVSQYPSIQREELRHTADQGQVSEGGVPPGVTAASAIAQIQGAENQRLSSPALLGVVGLTDMMKHALTVFDELYREPRMLTVPLRGTEQQTAIIKGGDFGPLDVIVERADGVEDSDTFRQEQVQGWLTAGLFNAPAPFQVALLRAVGQDWLADVIENAQPAIQAQQQQAQANAAQQQQQMQAQQSEAQQAQLLQQREIQDSEAGQKSGAAQQQAQAAAQAKAQENQAGREHEKQMADQAAQHQLALKSLELLAGQQRQQANGPGR